MTAIAMVYVVPGFVIAADGRRRWADQRSVNESMRLQETENQQKIFKAQFKGRDIAYALTGLAFNDDRTFDLFEESRKTATVLEGARLSNLYGYVGAFGDSIANAYAAAKKDGRFEHFGINSFCTDPQQQNTLATIFMAGYFRKNDPSLVMVTISHEDHVVVEPKTLVHTPPRNPLLSGSAIAELMYGKNDPRFAKYVRPITRTGTLKEAEEYAKNYIEACSDPIAAEIDPACHGIGGHIHMATLTRQEGFRWISGFEPKVSS
jgi:hypothetical protein